MPYSHGAIVDELSHNAGCGSDAAFAILGLSIRNFDRAINSALLATNELAHGFVVGELTFMFFVLVLRDVP